MSGKFCFRHGPDDIMAKSFILLASIHPWTFLKVVNKHVRARSTKIKFNEVITKMMISPLDVRTYNCVKRAVLGHVWVSRFRNGIKFWKV